ncbi:NADH:ubiquinone oxidoreductase, 30kDa subunit, partial [Cynara cardunculus var. scolymus]
MSRERISILLPIRSFRLGIVFILEIYDKGFLYQPSSTSEKFHRKSKYLYKKSERDKKDAGSFVCLHSITVILYVYGYNYLCFECAYDVAPGGLLAKYGVDQPEEVCIKVFASRRDPRIPSVSGVDFQERESYDMLGISYDNHPRLKRILMPESWIGWPLSKKYIAPNFYEIQDAH